MLVPPSLLVCAHGTASPEGGATTARLVASIAAVRPSVAVALCFLDVATPRLPDALAGLAGPAVVLPLLLSTGYHVQTDIPAAVAGRPDVVIARHLGPHEFLVDALADRLATLAGPPASVALVGAGSSRSEAADELATTADLLAARVRRPVSTMTMADDLPVRLADLPRPVAASSYLLADGQFVTTLRRAASGIGPVAAPLGTHPALVRLAWLRYDKAVRNTR